jgi:hypothetical protein
MMLNEYEMLQKLLTEDDLFHIYNILQGNAAIDCYEDLFEKLFWFYCDANEMPYGTAKATTGDPYQWIEERVGKVFNDNMTAKVK